METMSGDQHATDAPGHDDHAHAEEPLGPLDVAAWGAAALGVIFGLVIAACFVIATRAG
jgi:hypothetical protein